MAVIVDVYQDKRIQANVSVKESDVYAVLIS